MQPADGKIKSMIIIVDYGIGNLGSIQNMFKKINVPVAISSAETEILNAEKLILPGVGSFDAGMRNLMQSGLINALNKKVNSEKVPYFGICLGMQLLTKKSEEGELPGLGWINAETKKFNFSSEKKLKVPHMGWNYVKPLKAHPLVNDLPKPSRFYFVHSYYVKCENESDGLLSCDYGGDFICAIQKENIMGVQFHPEKSHKFGMQLLKNFAAL